MPWETKGVPIPYVYFEGVIGRDFQLGEVKSTAKFRCNTAREADHLAKWLNELEYLRGLDPVVMLTKLEESLALLNEAEGIILDQVGELQRVSITGVNLPSPELRERQALFCANVKDFCDNLTSKPQKEEEK